MPAPWILPAGRALLCVALGIAITFTGGHDSRFGLIAFGAFGVLTGLWFGAWLLLARIPAGSRTALLVPAIVSLVAGLAALAVTGGGMGYLVLLLSGWALVTGAVELVGGIRAVRDARASGGARSSRARDAILVGALTVVLGVVVLVLPPDLAFDYAGEKGISGVLTSSIIVVGALGFWAVIVGVLEAIAAASPRASGASAEAAS